MVVSEADFPDGPEGLTRIYNGHSRRAIVKLYGKDDFVQVKSFEKGAIEPAGHHDFQGNTEDCFYAHVYGRILCKTRLTEHRLGFLLNANKTYVWDGDANEFISVQERVKRLGELKENPREDVVFIYPPVGGQKVNMGLALFQGEPVYREAIMACDTVATPLLPMPLVEVLYPDEATVDLASYLIDQTCFTQPCLFAVSYALTKLLEARHIYPTAVMGHSVGEYSAAVAASVMDMPTAMRLVCERGRLMNQLPAGGAMISVCASRDLCEAAIQAVAGEGSTAHMAGSRVAVAASNCPTTTVVSGDWLALRKVIAKLPPGTQTMRMNASHADHSPCNDAIHEGMRVKLQELFAATPPSAPAAAMISTVTGMAAGEDIKSPEYWVKHTTSPVLFADGFAAFLDARSKSETMAIAPTCGRHHHRLFVELGTGITLRMIRGADSDDDPKRSGLIFERCLSDDPRVDDKAAFAHCLEAVRTRASCRISAARLAMMNWRASTGYETEVVAGILQDLGCQVGDDELAKVVDSLRSAFLDSKQHYPSSQIFSEAALGA